MNKQSDFKMIFFYLKDKFSNYKLDGVDDECACIGIKLMDVSDGRVVTADVCVYKLSQSGGHEFEPSVVERGPWVHSNSALCCIWT